MNTIAASPTIEFQEALHIVDAAVLAQQGRHLKNIEVEVLKGAWFGKTYDQIAADSGYAPEYIKHDVGPKLWQLLSASLGEKVSKTSLIAAITSKSLDRTSASYPARQGFSPAAQSLKSWDGPVPLDSAFYIERSPVESRCYAEIEQPGALIRIKAPSQMGKTSLAIRILASARQTAPEETAVRPVLLNLQRADRDIFGDLERLLRWFCAAVTRKLQLSCRIEDYWSDTFGAKSNCTAYFEDCLLPSLNGPLVLALDAVDEVFLHPDIADDFFSLLRSWYEEAAYGDSGNPLWRNLRLIVVHSTEVYIPLDINKSPFNVGLAVELQPFTSEQLQDLAQRYGVEAVPLMELMALVAGHPYLLQQALYYLSQTTDFTRLIQTAATDEGIYHCHLHRHLRSLQEHPVLGEAYQQVVAAADPVELNQLVAFKLHSMGLVRMQGNLAVPSCQLYQQYFRDRLASAR
ncbi:MAG: AAA-like domain-containing protein [Cyanophyceae cyanobacterium]